MSARTRGRKSTGSSPGGNYGWNITEGFHCYEPAEGCDGAGLVAPRIEYSHEFGCAIMGGFVYRGAAMPELFGWYVYGDYCTGRVWAVDTASADAPAIPIADTGRSITSFAQDKDGELYIVTANNEIDDSSRSDGAIGRYTR